MTQSSTPPPALVVLAAGMGSRYGGLKQLDEIGPNGETMLDYAVFDAIRAGFGKIVFVIREDFAEQFKSSVGSRFADQIEVAYAYQKLDDLPTGFSLPAEREKPWGTGHATYAARHEINQPFAVINADDFYGNDAYQKVFTFLTQENAADDYCLVGYQITNTLSEHGSVNRGVCKTSDGFLKSVEEITEISRTSPTTIEGKNPQGELSIVDEDALVSMNLWGFPASFMNQLESYFIAFLKEHRETPKSEFYIPSVVDSLITDGSAKCHVLETSSSWFGVTYPSDKPHVTAMMKDLTETKAYPSPLV